MRILLAAAVFGLVAASTTGCTLMSSDSSDTATVTLVTHDSWAAPQQVLDAFQQQSGIKIQIVKKGDAGAGGGVAAGHGGAAGDAGGEIDGDERLAGAGVAVEDGELAAGQPARPEPLDGQGAERGRALEGEGGHGPALPQLYTVDAGHRLSAVDLGDVCLNVDTGWFSQHGVPAPTGYDDLTDAKYKDLLAVENPATSSPGLAFLLGTVAKYGEQGWPAYWTKLKDNGVKADSGWEEAYGQDFSGSSGKGSRPIVVSYASSPAAEVGTDGKPRTKALLDTCYRQVEYAGVLTGTKQPDKAQKVIDFLLSQQFQQTVAENMYVYPTRDGVALPSGWPEVAPLPQSPASLPGDRVQAGREQWIQQWRSLLGQ